MAKGMVFFRLRQIQGRVNRFIAGLPVNALILASFLVLIIIGTFLLSFPAAQEEPTSLLNCFFTSTSAVCVTGLAVVPANSNWSPFGQVIILLLIQLGGLGLMTFYLFFSLMSKGKITVKERKIIQESFNESYYTGLVTMLKKVAFTTLMIELIGGFILSVFFYLEDRQIASSIWKGIFHGVTAFCNAGVDVLGDNRLHTYTNEFSFVMIVTLLIVLGGIGFSTINNLYGVVKTRTEKSGLKRVRLTLNTKMVLIITGIIIFTGSVIFFFLEYRNPLTIGNLTMSEKILSSFFHATALHAAGFNSINVNELTDASKFVSIIIMFIGGSPGGTAGGVKTVTMGVIIAALWSVIRGEGDIVIMNRKISRDTLSKALAVFMLHLGIILISTIALSVIEQGNLLDYEFLDILLETTAATTTVGVSSGITSLLTTGGKTIIAICMIIGRMGPLSILALIGRKEKEKFVDYPTEHLMIG